MSFDIFWQMYPRKVGKAAAEKAYVKAIKKTPEHVIRAALLQHVDNCKDTEEQYIPHPATWLNQGRWEDDVPRKSTSARWYGPSPQFPPDDQRGPERPRALTWANVFVPNTAPQYAGLLERAAQSITDPREFLYDSNGIWVTQKWIHE